MAEAPDKAIRCPFCDAENSELVSLFGSQLLLSQYRCKRCGSYFEAVRGEQERVR
jgi:transposase-like protein